MSYKVTGYRKRNDDPKNTKFTEQGIDVWEICYGPKNTHNIASLLSTIAWADRKGSERIECEKIASSV